MKKFFDLIKLVLFFLFIIFIVFFAIENSDKVKINFLFPFYEENIIEIRVFLLIVFSFSIGFICGIFSMSFKLFNYIFMLWKEKRKNKKIIDKKILN